MAKVFDVFDATAYEDYIEKHASKDGERACIHGRIFNRNWIMKLLLEFIYRKINLKVSVENTEFGKFDDFVVFNEEQKHICCFQFKNKASGERITTNDLCGINRNKSIYSIPYYFETFCKNHPTLGGSNDRVVSMILFTNRGLDTDLNNHTFKQVPNAPFALEERLPNVYKLFDTGINLENIKNRCTTNVPIEDFDTKFNDFINNFYLVVEQENNDSELTNDVKVLINELYGFRYYKDEAYNWFFRHFESWYKSGGFFILTANFDNYFEALKQKYIE